MDLRFSTAYHPPTDGQTERINEIIIIQAYLRAFTNYFQNDWEDWLDLAEFAYNNSRHSATGFSPFFTEHGYDPDIEPVSEYTPGKEITDVEAAMYTSFMKEVHEIVKENL